MKLRQAIVHIGKNGLTRGSIQGIKNIFSNRENVKVILLKGAGHEKENAEAIAENIVNELGKNYTYRIVGFTIFLKKWRKPVR